MNGTYILRNVYESKAELPLEHILVESHCNTTMGILVPYHWFSSIRHVSNLWIHKIIYYYNIS